MKMIKGSRNLITNNIYVHTFILFAVGRNCGETCIYEYEPHLCAGTCLGSSVHYDPVMRASCTNAVAVHK